MKTCKHCREEIHERASRCPKCQGVQYWYKNIPLLILIAIISPAIMMVVWVLLLNASRLFR